MRFMQPPVFHIALAVDDLATARAFYVDILKCSERAHNSGDGFAVLNFHDAQLVLVEAPEHVEASREDASAEIHRHFGIILDWAAWHQLAADLADQGVAFRIAPSIKEHPGIGRVGNLFIADPAGNYLEFKSYEDSAKIL
jgi:extradiol dioxygenase family protein